MNRDKAKDFLHRHIVKNGDVYAKWQIPEWAIDAVIEASNNAREKDAEDALSGKYGDVLRPFVAMMERELHANARKGDRPEWLKMTPAIGMLEIYYHASKLQKAVKHRNAEGIREYAADVANMSMMIVDVCGLLETYVDVSTSDACQCGVLCQDKGHACRYARSDAAMNQRTEGEG